MADQILAGTYKIVRRVGAGGMGEIYEATHERLAGRYAIKLLRPEVEATSETFARFQREAKVTSALRHPNIVQVIDFSQLDGAGAPFLVMEFLDGPVLSEVMKSAGGPLPLPRVLGIVAQLASGLTAAHDKEIVHRDLKPQNVFVLQIAGRNEELVKIVDFGISKVTDVSTTITSATAVMGTAHYMSPEQARGRVDEIDARSDQFSLAVMVYEMLTGEDAFRGESVSSIVYQIVHEEPRRLDDPKGPLSRPVASVLQRALSKNREERFSSVAAFARALEAAGAASAEELSRTVTSTAEAIGGAAPRRSPRRWAPWLVGAALAVGGASLLLSTRAAPPQAGAAVPTVPATPRTPDNAPSLPRATTETIVAAPPGKAEPDGTEVHAPPRTRRQAHPRPAAALPAAPAPATTKPAVPSCEPNFTLGPSGEKHFKPECFLDAPATK